MAFAGGGTGGHIYPALGIDDALRVAFAGGGYERRFFGNRHGLEAALVQTMPLTFIPSAPLRRRLSWRLLKTLASNAAGVVVALRALAAYRPALLVATGGYVCLPVVVAARLLTLMRLLDCRIALLEINARPGLTNRLLGPLVDEVWIAFAASRRFFRAPTQLTGTPVRAGLTRLRSAAVARRALGLAPDTATIVVFGGSQGARTINEAVAMLITHYALPWQVLHVSGERDYVATRVREKVPASGNRVRLVPYLDDPADAYAAADLVIARAGASTLAELALTATAAILVPYPYAADDHQAANAALFADAGAAIVVRDGELTAEWLLSALKRLLDADAAGLPAMRAAAALLSPAGANKKIVDRVTALLASRVADSGKPNRVARD